MDKPTYRACSSVLVSFYQAAVGLKRRTVPGVQTCDLPICAVVQRIGTGLVLPAVLAGHVAFMAVGQGALYLPPLGLYQPVCKRPGGWVVCLYPAHQRPAVQGTRFIRGNVTTV